MNFRYRDDGSVNIALDETTNLDDVDGDRRRLRRLRPAAPAAVDRSAWRLDTDLPGRRWRGRRRF